MKEKIIATDKTHLYEIIKSEIEKYGNQCDLNHINILKVTDISYFFYKSEFNGDISKWDTSSVTNMRGLFKDSKFNGNISNWNVSNVVKMNYLFTNAKFSGDISKWRPLRIERITDMFLNSEAKIPYWFCNNNEKILKNIKSYDLFNKMNKELENKNDIKINKIKI